jgi:fructosamine-3-kinase
LLFTGATDSPYPVHSSGDGGSAPRCPVVSKDCTMWNAIAEHITQSTGQPFTIRDRRGVGGGSINQAYQVIDSDRSYFLKINRAVQIAMFEAEALGLKEIADTDTIRVPCPICWGTADGSAYIVLGLAGLWR